ncbi:hypothetical protein JRQ81_006471, partial [Phrynocephalus forsythii]
MDLMGHDHHRTSISAGSISTHSFVYHLRRKRWEVAEEAGAAENDTAGKWSQDGCKTHFSQEGVVLCRCHHLTYFAVLLQISPATVEPALLGPLACLTDIGCGISAAACLFTILLHLFS